ncbi:MAG: hypothetical protein ACR2H1_14775 [Limisphaerales bacterium]
MKLSESIVTLLKKSVAKTFGALVLASALTTATDTWAELLSAGGIQINNPTTLSNATNNQVSKIPVIENTNTLNSTAEIESDETLNFELNRADREATNEDDPASDPAEIASGKLGIRASSFPLGNPVQESFGAEILSRSDRSRVENINAFNGGDDSGPQTGPPSMAILKPLSIVLAVMVGTVFFITALSYRSKKGFD